ncbi:uncharacterized protein ACA1_363200 [Acanthamoeba castellanii str. Neff]|uniref:Uncharacterized protein n=1 Tax=Acanthamoeba castellanii (strain ATCC 30010 / Neff) TaxID=1257118 RepID=L8GI04_ACACF|nr:uncharacterized protein ACA1_363200 [Acanthamoeba castellanii str. Neff]ELR11821.1 hypothetical protein ACA1_363200 [Acanthamoeba castellanii str. Neff]
MDPFSLDDQFDQQQQHEWQENDCQDHYFQILETDGNTYSEVALFYLGDGSAGAPVQFVHGVRIEYNPAAKKDGGLCYRPIQRNEAKVPRDLAPYGRVLSDFLAGLSQWPHADMAGTSKAKKAKNNNNKRRKKKAFDGPGVQDIEAMMLPVNWNDVPTAVAWLADMLYMPEAWRDRRLRTATVSACDLTDALAQLWAYVLANTAQPIFAKPSRADKRQRQKKHGRPVLDAARTWQEECAKNKPLTAERTARLVHALRVLGVPDAEDLAVASPAFLCAAGAEAALAGAVLDKYHVEPFNGPLRTSIPVDVFQAWSVAMQDPAATTSHQRGLLYFTAFTNGVPVTAEDEADIERMAARLTAIVLQEHIDE